MYCKVKYFVLYLQYQKTNKYLKVMNNKILYRPADDMAVAGVCSGLARYFGFKVGALRFVSLLFILFGGLSLWVYIILWILMPKR